MRPRIWVSISSVAKLPTERKALAMAARILSIEKRSRLPSRLVMKISELLIVDMRPTEGVTYLRSGVGMKSRRTCVTESLLSAPSWRQSLSNRPLRASGASHGCSVTGHGRKGRFRLRCCGNECDTTATAPVRQITPQGRSHRLALRPESSERREDGRSSDSFRPARLPVARWRQWRRLCGLCRGSYSYGDSP